MYGMFGKLFSGCILPSDLYFWPAADVSHYYVAVDGIIMDKVRIINVSLLFRIVGI